MSVSKHTKIITFGSVGSNQNNNFLSSCYKCGNSFKLGEEILTKRSGPRSRKRYHISCAKLVNLI